MDFANFHVQQVAPKRDFPVKWVSERDLFQKFSLMQLSKLCSRRGRRAHFRKKWEMFDKRVCEARRAQTKQHMAHEIHKVACVLHTIVFADRALEAENAHVIGEKQILMGDSANGASKGAIRTNKVAKTCFIPSF